MVLGRVLLLPEPATAAGFASFDVPDIFSFSMPSTACRIVVFARLAAASEPSATAHAPTVVSISWISFFSAVLVLLASSCDAAGSVALVVFGLAPAGSFSSGEHFTAGAALLADSVLWLLLGCVADCCSSRSRASAEAGSPGFVGGRTPTFIAMALLMMLLLLLLLFPTSDTDFFFSKLCLAFAARSCLRAFSSERSFSCSRVSS